MEKKTVASCERKKTSAVSIIIAVDFIRFDSNSYTVPV